MKKIGRIFDKICSIENLQLAYKNATKGKKYYKEVKKIEKGDITKYLLGIQKELLKHTYVTSKYHVFTLISGGKEREIYKLPMKDRIIQHAIMNYIEPEFRKSFITDTYSSIKGRGIHKGVKQVKKALKNVKGTLYCLLLDVKKFYPSINKEILKQLLRKKFKDIELLWLLDTIINSSEKGVPIGNYTSQYFANFYLTPMDHWIKEDLCIKYYFRYCDDIVIFHESKNYLRNIFYVIRKYLNTVQLDVKPTWQIYSINIRGVNFLGYIFYHTHTKIRKRIKKAFVQKLLKYNQSFEQIVKIIGSYNGMMCHANCINLFNKYIKILIMKSSSTIKPKLIEYIGSGNWRVRWDIESKETEDLGLLYTYNETEFKNKPTLSEIKDVILKEYNKNIDNKILTGFTWKDMVVWLSSENLFNYKAAYDLAVQTNGTNLPMMFKFGSTEEPLYYTFTTIEELSEFYLSAMQYINNTLVKGWEIKDNINWENYEKIELANWL